MSIRLLKAEFVKRNPKDHKAVEDVIAPRVRIDSIGEVYVVKKDGKRDDATSFEAFLDHVVRRSPPSPARSKSSAVIGTLLTRPWLAPAERAPEIVVDLDATAPPATP